jgi:hypothetical protein
VIVAVERRGAFPHDQKFPILFFRNMPMVGTMETQHVSFPKIGYSLAEVEVLSGLSRTSLYRLVTSGKLKTVRHGRRQIVPTSEVQRLFSVDSVESAA